MFSHKMSQHFNSKFGQIPTPSKTKYKKGSVFMSQCNATPQLVCQCPGCSPYRASLEESIQDELCDAGFYAQIANEAPTDVLREIITSIVGDEYGHARLQASLLGICPPPVSFPFLTGNVSDKKTGQAITFTKPYIMTERAGVKIGIIGVTTPETAYKVLPSIISAYEIADPTAIVNSLASELRQKGAKIIIVVGHLGAYATQNNGELQGEAVTLAKALKGVDVLVTGHTHQTYAENINGVAVVQAAYNGRAVANVELSYSPSEQKVVASQLNVINISGLNLSEDASIKAIIDADNEKIGPIKNKVIGKNKQNLPHDSSELSPLGQWFTDSIRKATNTDVVFINGGALRTNIPEGDITVGKLWEVLPFDSTLCTMSMTGMQINQVLQYGVKNQQYGMVQFSGLRIQYNGSLEPDKRILKVTLADGTPLQADKTYRVATNDFMAEGGDGFTMFKQCPVFLSDTLPVRKGNEACSALACNISTPQSKSWFPIAISSKPIWFITSITGSPFRRLESALPCIISPALRSKVPAGFCAFSFFKYVASLAAPGLLPDSSSDP